MSALDVDPLNAVENLADIDWTRGSGHFVSQQHLGHAVLHNAQSWATVCICTRVKRYTHRSGKNGKKQPPGWDPPRFILTRWRMLKGLWRLQDRFRLTRSHLAAWSRVAQLEAQIGVFMAQEDPVKSIYPTNSNRVGGIDGPPILGLPLQCCAPVEGFSDGSLMQAQDDCFDEFFDARADVTDCEDPRGDLEYNRIVGKRGYK